MNRCQIAGKKILACTIITVIAVAVAILLMRWQADAPRIESNLWLGIETVELNGAISRQYGIHLKSGLLVSRTFVGSPAMTAGIENGDVVRRWDGEVITSQRQFARLIENARLHQRVKLSIDRQGKQYLAHVRVGLRPGRAR
jgi:S1-C subfamily serine protease